MKDSESFEKLDKNMVYSLAGLEVRRYVFPYLQANMYILTEGQKALVIDPHHSQMADIFLQKKKIKEVCILLTHEHFDHTSGIGWFREKFNTIVICQKEALTVRSQSLWNNPLVVSLVLQNEGKEEQEIQRLIELYPKYTYKAECFFEEKLDLKWEGHAVYMDHIPGHSPASCMIVLDEKIVFTGDSLIPDTRTTLRWPGSSSKDYKEISLKKLLAIPDNWIVCPGHGEPRKRSELKFREEIFRNYVN